MHESSPLVMEATGTARAKLDIELIAAPALKLSARIVGRTPREAVLADILWHTFPTSLPILKPIRIIKQTYYYRALPKQELVHS